MENTTFVTTALSWCSQHMAPPVPCSAPGLIHGLHYRSLCRAQCLRQLQWPPSSLWQTQEQINYFCSMLPSLQLLSSPAMSRSWVRSCPLQVFCDDILIIFLHFSQLKTSQVHLLSNKDNRPQKAPSSFIPITRPDFIRTGFRLGQITSLHLLEALHFLVATVLPLLLQCQDPLAAECKDSTWHQDTET